MNQYTYNQLVDIFRNFADNHQQVKDFYSGDIANLKGDTIYPLMILHIGEIKFIQSQMQYNCNVVVIDRINSERDNQDEVYSDTVRVLADLISYLKRANVYDLIIDFGADVQKVTEQVNSDWVSGWNLSFTIRTKFDYNICNIPFFVSPLSISGNGDSSSVIPSTYLTCNTILGCQTLQNVLSTKANLSGATFSGNIFSPVISGETFYSGSTPLSTIIQNYISTNSGSTYINEFWESGSTGSMSVQLKFSTNNTTGNRGFTLGAANINTGNFGSVLNGFGNNNSAVKGTIINGVNNIVSGDSGLIGSGILNRVMTNYQSSTAGNYSFIGNGRQNYISAYSCSIINGSYNYILNSSQSIIVTGQANQINDYNAFNFIGNGYANKSKGNFATILNGYSNYIFAGGLHCSILGGESNTILSGANYTTIINGRNITANQSNTVYVPELNIVNLSNPNYQLFIDSTGKVYASASASTTDQVSIKPGLNTYTGGTAINPSVNISAATLATLTVLGNTSLAGLSATTISSGQTNLNSLFSPTGHTHQFSSILNTGHSHSFSSITSTGHTHQISEVLNLTESLLTKVNKSGDTMSGQLSAPIISATTFSATTIISGSTNLTSLFSPTGHTHQFSSLLSTGHTHQILEVLNLTENLLTKINLSGGSMSGQLNVPTVSASTITGTTFISGATNLTNIFSSTGHTHQFSSILNTGHSHSFSALTSTGHTHQYSDVLSNGGSDSGKTFVTNSSGVLTLSQTGTTFNANFGTGQTNVPQISSLGLSGASEVWTNSSGQLITKQPGVYLFAYGRTTLSGTGITTEEVLASVLIPGGTLGPNDSISITSVWNGSGSSNRVPRVRFGSAANTSGTLFVSNSTTNPTLNLFNRVVCKNSSSSQETFSALAAFGASASNLITTTLNIANDIYIVFSQSKSTGSEPWSLNNYDVIINRV